MRQLEKNAHAILLSADAPHSGRQMEIVSPKSPPMPGEYYRRQAAPVRSLAHDATTFTIREHLADVALQYEKLAESAEAGYRDPQ
jgi:hypothetical protein